jgi:2-oxoisovalerate dehydrogenase E1 component
LGFTGLFVIENNGFDYQRQQTKQYRCETFADKGAGYGMESHIIDGNNILESIYQKLPD